MIKLLTHTLVTVSAVMLTNISPANSTNNIDNETLTKQEINNVAESFFVDLDNKKLENFVDTNGIKCPIHAVATEYSNIEKDFFSYPTKIGIWSGELANTNFDFQDDTGQALFSSGFSNYIDGIDTHRSGDKKNSAVYGIRKSLTLIQKYDKSTRRTTKLQIVLSEDLYRIEFIEITYIQKKKIRTAKTSFLDAELEFIDQSQATIHCYLPEQK